MNNKSTAVSVVAIVAGAIGVLAGLWWARTAGHAVETAQNPAAAGKPAVLYWYDPMVPGQHFDQPGKSPFMDMALVPRFAAGDAAAVAGIQIDPRLAQNLGIRLGKVERRSVSQELDVPGTVVFNGREVANLQARAGGYVVRVYGSAPGERVARDAPIVDLLIPDWAAAQSEYLGLLNGGEQAWQAAGRQRLVLLGMPAALITQVEQTRQIEPQVTLSSPIPGVLDTLEVRAGMTVSAGMTLATIKGIDPIWIEADIAEAAAPPIGEHAIAVVRSPAMPGRSFQGRIIAELAQANPETHTLRVRIELPNRQGDWKPGMFARVLLSGGAHKLRLLVPAEAVIHTGRRELVILASAEHHFEPAEVQLGAQYGDQVEVLAGVQEGQQLVVSGQFLIDSEANLRGVTSRMSGPPPGNSPAIEERVTR
jgi:Cu(I)/Ag(I) efflux system membrane fusion protein